MEIQAAYGASGDNVTSHRPSLASDTDRIDGRLIEQVVLQAFALDVGSLRLPGRGQARVAFARQVAIYVAHVHLGRSLTTSGRLFCRDRTTAAHACRKVEDCRETPEVDHLVRSIEEALDLWTRTGPYRAAAGRQVLQ